MSRYQTHYHLRTPKIPVPQTFPIPGTIPNSAGGQSFPVDDWTRLDRFLILGSEGGTYYIHEHQLTLENAQAAARCLKEDGLRVVKRLVEISQAGRAVRNDPALFILALASAQGSNQARPARAQELQTRLAAFQALPLVARTGSDLLHWVGYLEAFRGWGRAARRSLVRWFEDRPAQALAHQVLKYQSRDGWAMRDLLRLAHPRPQDAAHQEIYRWICSGWPEMGDEPHPNPVLQQIWAFERLKKAQDQAEVARLITLTDLPREALPTRWLKEPLVWEALLQKMPATALLRNLATMTRVGLLKPMGAASELVCQRLQDPAYLRAGRVHPLRILMALDTYARGSQGALGQGGYQPVREILEALNEAFYRSFRPASSSSHRILLGIDCSGSMASSRVAASVQGKRIVWGLEARQAAAAQALVLASQEPQCLLLGFDTRAYPLTISPRQRLDDVTRLLEQTGGGGTDCSIPMDWALKEGLEVEAFIILTDSETWFGREHPIQALERYRSALRKPARLALVAMCSNRFSLVDEIQDARVLNVVGFDSAVPELIADFLQEEADKRFKPADSQQQTLSQESEPWN